MIHPTFNLSDKKEGIMNKIKTILGVSLSVVIVSFVSSVQAALITFEELPNGLTAMTNSPGSTVQASSQLSNQYLASNGVSFTSGAGYAALVIHGSPTASNPNIIGGTSSSGTLDYLVPITISFFDVSDTSVKAETDFFKIQGDWHPLGLGEVFATAYDATGQILGTTSDTDDKVFGVSGPVLQFGFDGIHSVEISGNTGTVGFDNLEFGVLTPVPEPSVLALMGLGLAGLGFARRRKQQA